MPNESVGTRFDYSLLGGDGHRRREEGTEYDDSVETQCGPHADQENTQPEEKNAGTGHGQALNLKSQQHTEESTKHDQAKEDHVRSFILALDASTETFECPDIHARFHRSPDEKARQPDTKVQQIMSEKRLH